MTNVYGKLEPLKINHLDIQSDMVLRVVHEYDDTKLVSGR